LAYAKSKGFETYNQYQVFKVQEKGFKTIQEYRNRNKPKNVLSLESIKEKYGIGKKGPLSNES
jgi:ssRNA-specific RNase YbeY (16S rRNA maturation enzyme)